MLMDFRMAHISISTVCLQQQISSGGSLNGTNFFGGGGIELETNLSHSIHLWFNIYQHVVDLCR